MADEVKTAEAAPKGSTELAMSGLGPEIDLTNWQEKLLSETLRQLRTELRMVAGSIIEGLKKGQVSSFKMLDDMSESVLAGREVPQEAYDSLAAVLWKSHQAQQQVQETGNRE